MKAALFQMNSVKDNISDSQGKKSKITPQPKMEKFKLFNLEYNFSCLVTFVDRQMWDLGLIKLDMNLAPYGRTFLEMLCTSQHFGSSEILLKVSWLPPCQMGSLRQEWLLWERWMDDLKRRFHNRSYFCSFCWWFLGDERNKGDPIKIPTN